jgi:lysosomal alpha-mannosidase
LPGAQFLILKKNYLDNYYFGFDLRYYPSYQGFQGSRSGAAIFKPAINESLPYSKFQEIYYQVTDIVSQITIIYNDTETQETALVKARIYKDLSMMEWEVAVGAIPQQSQGKEVIVVFETDSIDQQDLFFTDSNGLQMEPRMVNYRPRYYSAEVSSTFNVSVNYYPVTSAIIIRDIYWEEQMTVMTTRTQGGSAMQPGKIELMQSRRLNFDDTHKKGVILRESEEVTATYYLQIFNRNYELSEQRLQ